MTNHIFAALLLGSSITWLDCCSDEFPEPGENPSGGEPACVAQDGQQVQLRTRDGIELMARYYSSGHLNSKAVVLLHMIPPYHDLNNYTPAFIQELRERGFDVINVNRRGAKGSQGSAKDAHQGPLGWLDAQAGVQFLLDSPCKNDPSRIAMVGASNGTTTMIDYNIRAHHEVRADQPKAKAVVFLSGGSYTENQHSIETQLDALGPIPALFAYPQNEAEWNLGIKELAQNKDVACWQFEQYDTDAHGTFLFESNPEILDRVGSFLDSKVK